jgi:hypothetical protein
MFRYLAGGLALSVVLGLSAAAQDADHSDKPVDVRSPIGDLHVGKDADAQKAGLPLYPGARAKREADNDPSQLRDPYRKLRHEAGGCEIRVERPRGKNPCLLQGQNEEVRQGTRMP